MLRRSAGMRRREKALLHTGRQVAAHSCLASMPRRQRLHVARRAEHKVVIERRRRSKSSRYKIAGSVPSAASPARTEEMTEGSGI